MTSFQRLYDVYTTSLTSYRRRIDVETTSCVYWEGFFNCSKTCFTHLALQKSEFVLKYLNRINNYCLQKFKVCNKHFHGLNKTKQYNFVIIPGHFFTFPINQYSNNKKSLGFTHNYFSEVRTCFQFALKRKLNENRSSRKTLSQ